MEARRKMTSQFHRNATEVAYSVKRPNDTQLSMGTLEDDEAPPYFCISIDDGADDPQQEIRLSAHEATLLTHLLNQDEVSRRLRFSEFPQ